MRTEDDEQAERPVPFGEEALEPRLAREHVLEGSRAELGGPELAGQALGGEERRKTRGLWTTSIKAAQRADRSD